MNGEGHNINLLGALWVGRHGRLMTRHLTTGCERCHLCRGCQMGGGMVEFIVGGRMVEVYCEGRNGGGLL